MPCYNNLTEVVFTVQALRMYHDLTDCEIVVIDNSGDDDLATVLRHSGHSADSLRLKRMADAETDKAIKNDLAEVALKHMQVRYIRYTDVTGVSAAKNKIFDVARGEYVMVIDSHIMIAPGALNLVPAGDDFIQGPMISSNMLEYKTEWKDEWRGQMWGTWGPAVRQLPAEPFEIWAMGAGFFCCRRDSWLGFNPGFRGFGGETGYIQEKYRRAGRKVWCDPTKVWWHFFCDGGRKIPFKVDLIDRIKNYLLGFTELGMDTTELVKHFGIEAVNLAIADLQNTGEWGTK